MAFILDWFCAREGYDTPEYDLKTESDVKKMRKANPRDLRVRGVTDKTETEALLQNSFCLANYAKAKGDAVGLVYFKDSDRTNTAPHNRWSKMVSAIYLGFSKADYKWGVAMVPRPKSEAWLLAYYQKNDPHQHEYNQCARFEDMPGNDGSPNSLKAELKRLCGCEGNVYEEVITEEAIRMIDWDRIDMPSFITFRECFENVLAGINKRPSPFPEASRRFLA